MKELDKAILNPKNRIYLIVGGYIGLALGIIFPLTNF